MERMGLGEGQPPKALTGYTGFLLNWVAARSRRSFEEELEKLGLRLHGFALMNVVAADPGLTQQELVECTHIDPSTMVAALDSLEKAGFAERRPHASDRRKRAIHLTERGTKMLQQARRAARGAGGETLGRLDPAERRELDRLLLKMTGGEE